MPLHRSEHDLVPYTPALRQTPRGAAVHGERVGLLDRVLGTDQLQQFVVGHVAGSIVQERRQQLPILVLGGEAVGPGELQGEPGNAADMFEPLLGYQVLDPADVRRSYRCGEGVGGAEASVALPWVEVACLSHAV